LKKIFPQGIENFSQEEKTIEIQRFTVIDLKNIDNLGTATKILKDGYAICGGKSSVFQTLLRRLQIPTRPVAIYNTSGQGGMI
jgi:hypothetical protein